MELNGTSDPESNDFVQKLRAVFDERREKNKRYSLRAFARDLDIEASLLSKIFRGHYKLTSKMIIRLGQTLGLTNPEIGKILAESRRYEHLKHFSYIDDEVFQAISNWHYFAILRAFDFQEIDRIMPHLPDKLGISREDFDTCLAVLSKLGLLEKREGRWVRSIRQLSTFPCERTSDANKKVQIQFLEKAICSVRDVPVEDRDNTTITFSVDYKLLPEIKEEIARFRKHISYLVTNKSSRDTDIYNMSIALYPLLSVRK